MERVETEHIPDELRAWANPEPPEMSGPQWQDRMGTLIDILRGLGSINEELARWHEKTGDKMNSKAKKLIELATQLYVPDPLLHPPNSIEYSTLVTDLRMGVTDLADWAEKRLSEKASETRKNNTSKSKGRLGRPGRPKVSTEEAENRRRLKADWEQHRDTIKGANKLASFCKDKGISVEYLTNRVLRWCRDHSE